jgi:arylsulfatase A-like enzyme
MTGQHTGHCLVRANIEIPLRPKDKTIGEILKNAGYSTAIIGKWGLGKEGSTGVPNKKGFDFFYGVLTHMQAHNYFPDFVYRNEEHEATRNELEKENVAKVKVDYFPDLMTVEANKYFERAKDGPPFFLYLPYTLPHVNNEQDADHQNEIPSLGIYENKPWTHANKGHAAMITYLDTAVGHLIDKLKEQGLDKNTLVIFTADNGPLIVGGVDPVFFKSSGELRGYKRDLYEGGMRVPMIAWWPGHVPGGVVSDRPNAFWDLMPTFAVLAGSNEAMETDGVSIAPDLMGKSNAQPPKLMYWEVHEGGFKQAARVGDWKAILHRDTGKLELFDLATDVREQHDLAKDKADVAAQMRAYISEARTPPVPGTTPNNE